MKYQKIKETYLYSHKGIGVWVKIDYRNNKISLVEPFQLNQSKFQDKKWLFKERGVEYMQGWLDILDVMKEAIKDAKKRYEAELAETSKFTEKQVVYNWIKTKPKKK